MEDYNSYIGPDNTTPPNSEEAIRSESGTLGHDSVIRTEDRNSIESTIIGMIDEARRAIATRPIEEPDERELQQRQLELRRQAEEMAQYYNANLVRERSYHPFGEPSLTSIELTDDTVSDGQTESIPNVESRRIRRGRLREYPLTPEEAHPTESRLVPPEESIAYNEYIIRRQMSLDVSPELFHRIEMETGMSQEEVLHNSFIPPQIEPYDSSSDSIKHQRYTRLFNKKVEEKFSWATIRPLLTKRCSVGVLEQLDEMATVLEQVYPDNWDIRVIFAPKYKEYENEYGRNGCRTFMVSDGHKVDKFEMIVRFPEIRLKNSHGTEFLLKDLYIKQKFIVQNKGAIEFEENFEGARGTVTRPEFEGGYAHSHLPLTNQRGSMEIIWKNFCTGTGDINMVMSNLNADWDKDTFEMYLHQIKTYLEWESIEGGPHAHMEKHAYLRNYIIPEPLLQVCMNVFSMLRGRMRTYNIIPNINWVFKNGRYSINSLDEVDEFIWNIYNTCGFSDTVDMYYKDETDKLYINNQTRNSYSPLPSPMPYLIFKQQKISLVVEEQIELRNNNQIKYLHTKIRDYVKSRLEYYANKEVVKSTYINGNSNSNNNGQGNSR